MKKLRLGILFSGGKDSNLALQKATEHEKVVCLITLESKNLESYMFHTPNISLASLQADALKIPIIKQKTSGEKEKELLDLEKAIKQAILKFNINGIVTGAVESIYQAERVQRICNKLDIWCFNPLWKKNQQDLLNELIEKGYEVIISGVFAYPLKQEYLGKKIDKKLVEELNILQRKFSISPTGEGGEIETTVLDGPLFLQKIRIQASEIQWDGNSGKLNIKKAILVGKK